MTNFQRCPYGRNWCGRWHPKPLYWGGLSVDDVAAQFPAGKMVLLSFYGVRMPGSRDRKAVFIVPPAGRDLYIELTGWSGVPPFLPERGPSAARAERRHRMPQRAAGAEGDLGHRPADIDVVRNLRPTASGHRAP